MFVKIVLVIAMFPAFASAQAIAPVSRAALWGGLGYDLGTTFYGIRNDGRREANALLGKRNAQIAVTSIGLTVLTDFSASKLAKAGHPKQSALLRFFGASLHIGAGTYNIKSGTRR